MGLNMNEWGSKKELKELWVIMQIRKLHDINTWMPAIERVGREEKNGDIYCIFHIDFFLIKL
jgi:hypothetical protein